VGGVEEGGASDILREGKGTDKGGKSRQQLK
jgi:hypothetical protein